MKLKLEGLVKTFR